MGHITFENPAAKAVYQRILKKTPLGKEQEQVKKVLSAAATLDNNTNLSEYEAKDIEFTLQYYDQQLKQEIGLFNAPEIDATLQEIKDIKQAIDLFDQTYVYDNNTHTLTIDRNNLKTLEAFVQRTEVHLHAHPLFTALERRINSDLHPDDHLLLFG